MGGKIKNIVIADDDQDDVDLFQSAVDETCSHLNLSVAEDGTKLMKLLNDNPAPDAIFLDLNMLGKSGRECLEEIRDLPKFDDVPLVILSTTNRKSEIEYCLNNGADHYFVKPHHFDGLKIIVEDLCSGRLSMGGSTGTHSG